MIDISGVANCIAVGAKRKSGRAVFATACSVGALLAGSAAHAQVGTSSTDVAGAATVQATPGGQPAVPGRRGDVTAGAADIIVTGSRLRGTAPVGASVSVVDRATIVASGANNVAQVVSQVPALTSLGFGEASKGSQGGNNNTSSVVAANLRGLGVGATLTLLEGHRLPLSGNGGYAVDLNSVPTIALERVEVLADGASAVYGSDAVAGVVNLILRRNVEGIELSSRYGFGDYYSEYKLGGIFGHRWSSGQITAAVEQSNHTALHGRDRGYNRQDLTSFGGINGSSTQCFPANVVVGGVNYPIGANGTIGTAGSPNTCEPNSYNDILPRIHRLNGSVTADLDITDRLHFSGDASYSRRTFKQEFAFTPQSISVPQTNAFFQLPPGVALTSLPLCAGSTTTRCEPINWSVTGLLGNTRDWIGHEAVFSVHPQLAYTLVAGWKLRAEATVGKSSATTTQFNYNSGYVATAVASSDPATALDPYDGRTSALVAATVRNYIIQAQPTDRLDNYDLTLDGGLLTLPAGDVKVAINGEYRHTHFTGRGYTGPTGTPFYVSDYKRGVRSISGEVAIPLFSAQNARPLLQSLILNAAVRNEHYSDFGSTTNPRIGGNWSPIEGLTLKANYSTSFHAPTAVQLVGVVRNSIVYLPALDAVSNSTVTTLQINAANPNLKPETSKNYSFGAEFAPRALRGLRINATYFSVDYRNVIESQFNNPNVLIDPAYATLVTRNPTAAQVATALASYTRVNTSSAPVAAIIDGSQNNLGRLKVTGVDFDINYDLQTRDIGRFNFFVNGTYLQHYLQQLLPSAPTQEKINQYSYPVRFRARGGVNWTGEQGLTGSVFANFVNSYRYNASKVKSFTTFDLYAAYKFHGDALLSGLTLGLNIQNLFDRDPPFINIPAYSFNPGGYDPQQASALGRVVSFTGAIKF